jgi:hypothetical protein
MRFRGQRERVRISVYRVFEAGRPTYSPNERISPQEVADSPNFVNHTSLVESEMQDNPTRSQPFVERATDSFLPFKNKTAHMFANWIHKLRGSLSNSHTDNLAQNVMNHPEFVASDLKDFRTADALKKLDTWNETTRNLLLPNESWIQASVPLALPPASRGNHPPEASAPVYNVEGLVHRKPLEVIKEAFMENVAQEFHISTFAEYWKPSPDSPPERIYSDLYNSDAFIEEDRKLRAQPRVDDLEPVIAAVMLYSDSTHLTSFGTASMWPIYMYFGNLSKYTRGRPSSFSAHHLAYIPKVRIVPFSQVFSDKYLY